MLSVPVQTTVTVGNHLLTAAEQAAGVPQRPPFVDDAGDPVDPDTVLIVLTSPDKVNRSFGWPVAGPEDVGVCERQETGRFFVLWAPDAPEDGLWRWYLKGEMTLGSKRPDQDVFYVQRPIAPAP
jgi:hypothetical protein